MGSSCCAEHSVSRASTAGAPHKDSLQLPSGNKSPNSADSPKAPAPKRFVSVINDKDITQLPLTSKWKGSPTSLPRELSIDSCDELSLDAGGATPSDSFYSSRASPKNRTNVSFVHSDDVVIPEEDLSVPYEMQLASPRCSSTWSHRWRSVNGVLGHHAQ